MSSSLVAREDAEKYLRESGDVPAANVSQLAVSLSQILEDFAAVDDDERKWTSAHVQKIVDTIGCGPAVKKELTDQEIITPDPDQVSTITYLDLADLEEILSHVEGHDRQPTRGQIAAFMMMARAMKGVISCSMRS